jgi:hypothetical protein
VNKKRGDETAVDRKWEITLAAKTKHVNAMRCGNQNLSGMASVLLVCGYRERGIIRGGEWCESGARARVEVEM